MKDKSFFKNYRDIIQDKEANSLSFFYKTSNPIITDDIMKELKRIAFETKQNIRLNLHKSPYSPIHNMVIFHWKNTYVRPHKHISKSETCHLIEGEQLFITFDDNIGIKNKFYMDKQNFFFKTDINQYHMNIPLSEYVIFHEIKTGPFEKMNDSIFMENTDFKNQEDIEKFKLVIIES